MGKYVFVLFLILVNIILWICICKPKEEKLSIPRKPKPDFILIGKVISISDGDTCTIFNETKEKFKVRLAEIDAPEKKQAYYQASKDALAEMIFNKDVKISWKNKDIWGRLIGTIHIEDLNVNKKMIENGWAWHYIAYSNSKELAKLQEDAKTAKIGIWQDPNPIPPWIYRAKK